MIEADFALTLPGFELSTRVQLPSHGVTALFGPSGSGKSTMLRCLAGLARPEGRLFVNGEVWQDDKTFLAPHQRPIGMVFQDSALFPHLNVQQNLDFGAKRTRASIGTTLINTRHLIELLGIGHLLQRRTDTLSGGEKQRVAIARALFSMPQLLLLDEPLAALDAQRKAELLPYLDTLHQELKIPVVYVSHAPEEVARLADHIVRLDNGRIVSSGPTMEEFPRLAMHLTEQEATFALIAAEIDAHDEKDSLTLVRIGAHKLWVRAIPKPVGSPVRLRILARDISLALDPHNGSSSVLNILPTEVAGMEETEPGRTLVRLKFGDTFLLSRITTRSARMLQLRLGQPVYAQIKGVAPLE